MVPNSGAVEAGRVDTTAAVTPQIQGTVIEATIVAQHATDHTRKGEE
jgi:hypothetical protein